MPANLFAVIRPYESGELCLRIYSPLFAPIKIVFLSLFTTLHHSVILRREIRVFLRME